jgi:hypothetical protein
MIECPCGGFFYIHSDKLLCKTIMTHRIDSIYREYFVLHEVLDLPYAEGLYTLALEDWLEDIHQEKLNYPIAQLVQGVFHG